MIISVLAESTSTLAG